MTDILEDKVNNPDEQPYMDKIVSRYIKLDASEVRAVCERNPNHPLSATYLKATRNSYEGRVTVVFQKDMQAIQQNRELVMHYENDYPYRIVERRLGDLISPPLAEAPEVSDVEEVPDGSVSKSGRGCCGG